MERANLAWHCRVRNGSEFVWGKGIGKESVRSGQARCFGFPRQQSEASWPMLLCMELSHGFCIPKVDLCF